MSYKIERPAGMVMPGAIVIKEGRDTEDWYVVLGRWVLIEPTGIRVGLQTIHVGTGALVSVDYRPEVNITVLSLEGLGFGGRSSTRRSSGTRARNGYVEGTHRRSRRSSSVQTSSRTGR
jgi:hypothetical protein